MAYLERINRYPVKSLDGESCGQAVVLASGAVDHDRRFAIFDAAGEVVNGKRTDAAHRLRSVYDPLKRTLSLRLHDAAAGETFDLDRQRTELERWLADYFELPEGVRLLENAEAGFPDDTQSPGPTVLSTATLQTVAGWYDGLTTDEVRKRFRPTLEIGGVEPFWEERLFGEVGQAVEFQVGAVRFAGVNPCPRCVVPTRWAATGQVGPDAAFAKTFAERRRQTLPNWANASRFDHFYYLAVNTRLATPGQGGRISVGDVVAIAS
ncbi:MAG TPA: MOSC N-terminal beta barrel domain-containing protein [Pirellulales bacterium]